MTETAPSNSLPFGAGPDIASLQKLDDALIKARDQYPKLLRNGTNPAFKSRSGDPSCYATLDDVITCVMPALTEQGVNVATANWFIEGRPCVITTISHKSGGFRQSVFPMSDPSPQKIGGCMTYAQRYQICSLLGLQAEDDDDGNTAQGIKSQNGKPSAKPAKPSADSWL